MAARIDWRYAVYSSSVISPSSRNVLSSSSRSRDERVSSCDDGDDTGWLDCGEEGEEAGRGAVVGGGSCSCYGDCSCDGTGGAGGIGKRGLACGTDGPSYLDGRLRRSRGSPGAACGTSAALFGASGLRVREVRPQMVRRKAGG